MSFKLDSSTWATTTTLEMYTKKAQRTRSLGSDEHAIDGWDTEERGAVVQNEEYRVLRRRGRRQKEGVTWEG